MISLTVAKREVARLSQLPYPPQFVEGWQELADALAEVAISEAHAKGTITRICRDFKGCPSALDIQHVAWQLIEPEVAEATQKRLEACPHCGGSGWIVKRRGNYEGAERCSCSEVTAHATK